MNVPFIEIIIPIAVCGFLAICCTSFCKMYNRARKERLQRLAAETHAWDQTSVYVIPIAMSEDDLHRPPQYSTMQIYDLPPAYNQMKPESPPLESPPPYTEIDCGSPSHS